MIAVIEKEPYSPALHAEIMPLAQKCWQESTIIKADSCAFYGERDFDIEPFIEAYEGLNSKGVLVVITLRVDGALEGFIEGFSYRAMHHSKIVGGIADSIYIEPKYRSYTGVLIERFEGEMSKLGVGIIGWPTQKDGPVYNVLVAKGYVGDDIVMEKRIRQCA